MNGIRFPVAHNTLGLTSSAEMDILAPTLRFYTQVHQPNDQGSKSTDRNGNTGIYQILLLQRGLMQQFKMLFWALRLQASFVVAAESINKEKRPQSRSNGGSSSLWHTHDGRAWSPQAPARHAATSCNTASTFAFNSNLCCSSNCIHKIPWRHSYLIKLP